jgi:hypothetical protein
MSHERPDRACHLVCERHDRDVLRSSREQPSEPRVELTVSSTLRGQYRAGTVDQQRSQVRVAALADAEQLDPAAGARLRGSICLFRLLTAPSLVGQKRAASISSSDAPDAPGAVTNLDGALRRRTRRYECRLVPFRLRPLWETVVRVLTRASR